MSEDRNMTEVGVGQSRRRAAIGGVAAGAVAVLGVGAVLAFALAPDTTSADRVAAPSSSASPSSSPDAIRTTTHARTPSPTPAATATPAAGSQPGTGTGSGSGGPPPAAAPPVTAPPVVAPPPPPPPNYTAAEAIAAVQSNYGGVWVYGACFRANYGTWSRYSTPPPPVYAGVLGFEAGADGTSGWVTYYSCE